MRHTLKLMHPKHGCIKISTFTNDEKALDIIQSWKKLYGKKFDECIIEKDEIVNKVTKTKEIPPELKEKIVIVKKKRQIVNAKTGDPYESCTHAAIDLNVSRQTIQRHLLARLKGRFEYLVKYAN